MGNWKWPLKKIITDNYPILNPPPLEGMCSGKKKKITTILIDLRYPFLFIYLFI